MPVSAVGSCEKVLASGSRTMCLLVLAALTAGCATAGAARGGWPDPGLPPDMDEEVLEEGAEAEASRAVAEVWAVASGVREVGAQLSFTFWSERGALTLTGYTATGRGGPLGAKVDEHATRGTLDTLLQSFAQQRTGMAQVNLEREETAWKVGYTRLQEPRPPEAKTLPVRRVGLPAEIMVSVTQGMGRILKAVDVPGGREALVEVAVHLEDGRVEEWKLQRFEVTRRSQEEGGRRPGPRAADDATMVVLPFTQGLGERTVHLRLKLTTPKGAQWTGGWVEEARVLRLPPSPDFNAEFASEYRRMHEDILRRWREETKEGAAWVAREGAEELALWYAGGIVTKGLGWLGARTLPTVMAALRRTGEASAGWLRTTLSRLPAERKKAFERLWAKVQLEGKRALSKDERDELRGLMEGIEQLVHTPLDRQTKNKLREKARDIYAQHHPDLANLLKAQGRRLPIHHRRPLEYAHCFPDEDINAANNLIMLPENVHNRINALWTKFRQARPHTTAAEVETVARTLDDRFRPWFHQPSEPRLAPYSLKEAEESALKQLQRLFPGLQ
jgi:hypothetical protein